MKNSFFSVRLDENNALYEQAIKREHALYERGNSIRSEFDRDYTRLINSLAFRRLKHKTQVFLAPTNDHVCTRMEHVIHVKSVSETIAKYLGLNTDLTSAIAIGHDIGHAPFGHHGEDCLNTILKEQSNNTDTSKNSFANNANGKKFWHERNSLFFADYIETVQDPQGIERNLNLTYAVRDGLICHCGEIDQLSITPRREAIDLYSIKQAGSVQPYTWEGCVVKISDKIAYLGRDLEDARRYHIIDMSAYRALREIVANTLGVDFSSKAQAINASVIVNALVADLCAHSSIEEGLCFSKNYFDFLTELKKFNIKYIYNHWRLVEFEKYATLVIKTVFDMLMRTFPYAASGKVGLSLKYFPQLRDSWEDWLVKYSNYESAGTVDRKNSLHYETLPVFDCTRIDSYTKCTVEYISGMTDHFAIAIYNEIISF